MNPEHHKKMQQQQQQQLQQQSVLIQVPNGVQGTPIMIASPPPTPGNVANYKHGHSIGVGATLIVIGCLSIIANIVDLAVNEDNEVLSLGFIGHGIWSGIMCIITGSFGVEAGRHPSKRLISTFLVLSICALMSCLCQLSVGIPGAVLAYESCQYHDECDNAKLLIAMESLLAIFGAIGGIAALWGAALCWKAGFCYETCGCCLPEQNVPVQVIQYGAPVTQHSQPNVYTNVAAPNYSGVQMMVQPASEQPLGAPPAYTSDPDIHKHF